MQAVFGACVLNCVRLFCDPMDCCPPGSSLCGILQARILEWVAIPFPREPSPPRDGTWVSGVSCIARWILHHRATQEAPISKVSGLGLMEWILGCALDLA